MSQAAKNVLLIVFDYMGYGDIEPFGAGEIRTPNIKRLAEQGRCYTDFYGAAPICGPSRAAMLTGRYPRHLGIERNVEPGEPGLLIHETSLPRYFRDAGFRTALYGKWHLGHDADDSPIAHGFEEFLGFDYWNIDYYSHRTREGEPALRQGSEIVERPGYTTDLFTEGALDFIGRCGEAGERFFLYLAYNAMLPPYAPPGREADFADRWVNGNRADYVAAVEYLDESVGRVLEALDHLGLADETAVLLTYDHGGGELATKGGFFHGFGTLWEGGIRVPMILRWPGGVEPGSISAEPAIIMDVTPTLLATAGLQEDRVLDGRSLLGDGQGGERTLHWRIDLPGEGDNWLPRKQRALRRGQWKYLWDGTFDFLFDLSADPGERNDLGYQNPELIAELRQLSKGDW